MAMKARNKVIKEIKDYGYTRVSARDSMQWPRRETLRVLEDEGIIKLNIPVTSSLLVYSAGPNFPVDQGSQENVNDSLDGRSYWQGQIDSAKRKMQEWPQWMRDNSVFHGWRRK